MNAFRILAILCILVFGARLAFAAVDLAQRVHVAQSKFSH